MEYKSPKEVSREFLERFADKYLELFRRYQEEEALTRNFEREMDELQKIRQGDTAAAIKRRMEELSKKLEGKIGPPSRKLLDTIVNI